MMTMNLDIREGRTTAKKDFEIQYDNVINSYFKT